MSKQTIEIITEKTVGGEIHLIILPVTEFEQISVYPPTDISVIVLGTSKAALHALWTALKRFRKALPRHRKGGRTCPACGAEVDDRAMFCYDHRGDRRGD